jgi:hypothetical protein
MALGGGAGAGALVLGDGDGSDPNASCVPEAPAAMGWGGSVLS